MGRLHCGIDIGTTNLKVVLIDEAGRQVATLTAPTPRQRDAFGPVTDAAKLVVTLEEMLAAAWRTAKADKPLASIATTGVGEDGIGVDAVLRPTGLAIPWFDDRAAAEAAAFDRYADEIAQAGIRVDPSRTAAKWLWLKRNRPDELAAAKSWLALTDYPAAVWSGTPFMSETLAARTACYDVYARRWIPVLLDHAGAPPLPVVRNAASVVGAVRSGALTEAGVADTRTVIAAGGHDHPVAAWAVRRIDPDAWLDSLGTANLCYSETVTRGRSTLDPYLAFSVPVAGGTGISCLGVFEFSATLAPFGDLTDVLAGVALPGAPARRPPLPRPEVCAAGGDIRAALDACALYARRMIDSAVAAGAPPGQIVATGGWARSAALMKQRASVFGRPVKVVDEPELTALSAALLGARGAGIDVPLETVRKSRVVEPVPAWVDAYDEIYAGFRPLLDDMVGRRM